MKKKEPLISTMPSITLNKSLEQYKEKVLFPEKLAKANEMLKKTGLPKHTSGTTLVK